MNGNALLWKRYSQPFINHFPIQWLTANWISYYKLIFSNHFWRFSIFHNNLKAQDSGSSNDVIFVKCYYSSHTVLRKPSFTLNWAEILLTKWLCSKGNFLLNFYSYRANEEFVLGKVSPSNGKLQYWQICSTVQTRRTLWRSSVWCWMGLLLVCWCYRERIDRNKTKGLASMR